MFWLLALLGIGGYYRHTTWSNQEGADKIVGPFKNALQANPYAGARIHFMHNEVKYHLIPPAGAEKPPTFDED
jgi:hypothetical protein